MPDPLAPYVPRLLQGRAEEAAPSCWEREGTLVFADVSGFTRLTEKLSREGKAGAEEIVRTISDVFSALLDATADGGDVLRFSGDALLLFYDSPDHAQRAGHAALTMQRALREAGRIDSSRGRVRLRMRIGAHSDRFSFFLCGRDHLELYVLGAAASTAVAAEAAAQAGEVLVSHATAALLEEARFGAQRGDTVVLRGLAPLPPLPRANSAPIEGLERFVAPPLRTRLVHDDLEYEHRRATVAFVHFGSVDKLLRGEGPNETLARVQTLTAAVMDALAEYDVLLTATDVGTDGGRLMLTAGAPDATGDDEARMLLVARRAVEASCDMPVRVGINAGDVFVGAVGAPFRRTYSTMGAATNLAARVTGATPWGKVLATDAVVQRARGRFSLRAVPPFTVKGVRAPVRAWTVEGATEAASSQADVSSPFVGRTGELDTLLAALAQARHGRGCAVEVIGGAGIGKSRLVAEVQARAKGTVWAAVACDPYARTSPYEAARILLRQVLGIAPDAAPETAGIALRRLVETRAPQLLPWLPLVASATGALVPATAQVDEIAPRYRRQRTHDTVAELLTAVATDPTVLVVEDAEHADDASAELLAAVLARALPAMPWLVIVTRTDTTDGLHAGRGYEATELRLAPLDPATTYELAARLAERSPVPAHQLPQLVERAAGNPLFLSALVSAQTAATAALPRSVEALLAARIDQLDPDDRRALRYLSVLGDRFSADLVDAVLAPLGVHSGQTERWARLSDFLDHDGQELAFSNRLVREVAYEGLSFRRRRELHGHVADVLERTTDGRAAHLPLHLLRAERWRDAWARARTAADGARSEGANAVAGELYDMALRAARRLDLPDAEVASVACAAGESWERAGLWPQALDAYTTAADVTSDEHMLLMITLRRARVHEAAGRSSQALRLYARVLHDAENLPHGHARDGCQAWAHLGYASARLGQGRALDAVTHAEMAVTDATAAADDRALAQAYHLLDRAHVALGDHDTAARFRDQALPVFAALGDLAAQGTVLHDLGADAQRTARLDEALWLYEQSYQVRTRAGDVVRAAASANAIGEVLMLLGRPDEARAQFTDALRTWRGARAPRGVAKATRNLGVVALRSGDPAGAVALLEEAVALAASVGADDLETEILLPLAEALLALGRFVEAWEIATRALAAADVSRRAAARRLRSEALRRTGGEQRAHAELEAAEALEATSAR